MSITIQVSPKYKKFDPAIQLLNVADQLSKLLYGKSFSEITGQAQTIKVNTLKKDGVKMSIVVRVTRDVWTKSTGGHIKGSGWGQYKQNTQKSINSMIAHARTKGFVTCLKIS